MQPSRVDAFARAAGLPLLGEAPVVDGHDPVFRYPIAIGEAAATVHALCADAALELWARSGHQRPDARLDVRTAAASLVGASVQLLEGEPENPRNWEPGPSPGMLRPWGSEAVLRAENATNPVVGLYRGRDGRWIHLHGGAPHLSDRIMGVLGGEKTAEAINAAVSRWDSFELEEALAAAETCGVVARTTEEWLDHPQGRAVAELAAVDASRVVDSPAHPSGRPGPRPLSGVRVLDLGDGLAGPVCGRTLARYGADVLQIVSPGRGFIEPFVVDTGFGKRSAALDLTEPADKERFAELLSRADVLCQSFRPGVLDKLGFPAERRWELNPGLVLVSINCYGPTGPWAGRRGWEQLGQMATGLGLATSVDGRPRLAPATLCDCLTGFFASVGVMRSLLARDEEGGAWDVAVSLCQTSTWLSRLDAAVDEHQAPPVPDFSDVLRPTRDDDRTVWHPPPVVEIEGLEDDWPGPPPRLGSSEPRWLDD